jgi:hypothetical protein
MHNEVRKERYNIKYFVGCEDLLAKYIKETCNMADFSDNEILTALGIYHRGLQRDVVYLGCPIAPLVYEPKCGGKWGGGSCWVSVNEYSCTEEPK